MVYKCYMTPEQQQLWEQLNYCGSHAINIIIRRIRKRRIYGFNHPHHYGEPVGTLTRDHIPQIEALRHVLMANGM
jgi:hypothetical protein